MGSVCETEYKGVPQAKDGYPSRPTHLPWKFPNDISLSGTLSNTSGCIGRRVLDFG